MGNEVGLYRGIVSAIADTMLETAGFLLVRAVGSPQAGDLELEVDGLHRWPLAGKFIVAGVTYTYTTATVSPTLNRLEGLTREYQGSTVSGLAQDLREGDVVTYWGRDLTDVDLIRQSFFLETAEGSDLDLLGRNYGVARLRGMTDTVYRNLLKVMLYLDATTMWAVEKVLDVLVGAGNYDLWDTPTDPDDHHIVFVDLYPNPSDVYKGKTFLCGAEPKATTGTYTADADFPPVAVYGVYQRLTDDPCADRRSATNYARRDFNGFTDPASPQWLQTTMVTFDPSDTGRSVIFSTGEIWRVVAVLGPYSAELGVPSVAANVSVGTPDALTAKSPIFRPWMEGHGIQVTTSLHAGNYQTATIDTVVNESTAQLSSMSGGGWVASETDLVFSVIPDFGTIPTINFSLFRATIAGSTITTETPIPGGDVWLDYATIPSAQVVYDHTVDGNDQYPFYLFDDTWFVDEILDLILAAGVHPEVNRLY